MKKRGTREIDLLEADDNMEELRVPNDHQSGNRGLKINLEKAKLK